mgnify:CR=1
MSYLNQFKYIALFLLFLPIALASDDEIIKNLEFYENFDVYVSEEYEQIIIDEEDKKTQSTEENNNV